MKLSTIITAAIVAITSTAVSAWEFHCTGYDKHHFGNLIISKEDNMLYGFSLDIDYQFQGTIENSFAYTGQYDLDGDGIYPKFWKIEVSDGTEIILEMDKAKTDKDGWTSTSGYLRPTHLGGAYEIGRCGWKS